MTKDSLKFLEREIVKLKEQNDRLQRAQFLSGLGIWQYDVKTGEVTWSEEVYRIYEWDLEDEAPTINDVFNFSSPEAREEVEKTINKAIAKGESYSVDCPIITRKGELKYLHAIGEPYFRNEELVFLFGTIKDVTSRKKREEKLRLSDFTIESVSEGIYWIDKEATFYQVNNGAMKQLGYTREELLGLSGKDINPNFTKKKSQEYWRMTRENEGFTFETVHRKKNGDLLPVEITNNILMFEGEEFRVSIVRDITERKEKETEILNALGKVEQLKNQLEKENVYLKEEIDLQHSFDQIITTSNRFKELLKQVEQVASTVATVLITGESGTGKELLARAIHSHSDRREKAMVMVNCAALPENLIESELFGHEKGAFTGATDTRFGRFELAKDTTLFLDEIGEIPLELQAKLLRVLQEGEFERLGGSQVIHTNARIVVATNRNLEEEIINGNFREDLYYRLNVFPIESIPLRERKEDIPLLVKHFINFHSNRNGKNIESINKNALDTLVNYSWPGNIRELENLIERAVIITSGKVIEFGNWLPKKNLVHHRKLLTLEEMEKKHIAETLKRTDGRISGNNGAAKLLGMNANTLYSRLKKYNILPKKLIEV